MKFGAWPWHTARDKRQRAAFIVLLGISMYPKLTAKQRKAVDAIVTPVANMGGFPHRLRAGPETTPVEGAFRAAAMYRLEIRSGSSLRSWESLFLLGWKRYPQLIVIAFNRQSPESSLARRELEEAGCALPEFLPNVYGAWDT